MKLPAVRPIFFWTHLACGLIAGLVVFSMSLTGVLLTYERQIINWSARGQYVPAEQQGERHSLEQLTQIALSRDESFKPTTLTLTNDPGAPVSFRAGRAGSVSLNPYDGEEMHAASPGMESFFRSVTSFHRWFSLEGESRNIGRWVTGISNLVFLFLILSGIYLWLPRIWRWTQFRIRFKFLKNPPSSKARDYNWHHVLGIWAAIPLAIIVYTGAIFFFTWPSTVLNTVFGAEAPPAGPGPGPGRGPDALGGRGVASESSTAAPEVDGSKQYLNLDQLYAKALTLAPSDWNSMSITLPEPMSDELQVSVDWGNGAQAYKRETLVLNRDNGELKATRGFAETPKAQRIRGIVRYLHTGEVFGIVGQTIAGLVSAIALVMVWTGFALSYRRLIQPLLEKKKKTVQ